MLLGADEEPLAGGILLEAKAENEDWKNDFYVKYTIGGKDENIINDEENR